MNPPQHAAVFCVDEKTATEAPDWLDPVLPSSPERAERHGFEYYRHGTFSLYAALDIKTGEAHGMTAEQHTAQQFIAFLNGLVERWNAPTGPRKFTPGGLVLLRQQLAHAAFTGLVCQRRVFTEDPFLFLRWFLRLFL
jgi:hypothetical protein